MKAKNLVVIGLLLGTIVYDSLCHGVAQATALKSRVKSDNDDIDDLVDQALNRGLGSTK